MARDAVRTNGAALLGLGQRLHRAFTLSGPVGAGLQMQKHDVDHVDAKLVAEAFEIRFDTRRGLGRVLGQNTNVSGPPDDGFGNVRVRP